MIKLSVPSFNGNERKYLDDAISKGEVLNGYYTDRLEDAIGKYVNAGCVCMANGTSALHIALLECGVGKGDKVIVPTVTFISPVNAIRYVGAEPVFMDCNDNLNIDTDKTLEYLRNNKVKAIILVHVFGKEITMQPFVSLLRAKGIKIIEDASEALGTFCQGCHVGTFGDYGVFSFNFNKIITAGGGGCLVSKKHSLDHARYLISQAKDDPIQYRHDEIGYNYRLSNLQSAVGLAQFERLDEYLGIKLLNSSYYKIVSSGGNHWFYWVLCDNAMDTHRELLAKGIETRPLWKLCHTQKQFKGCEAYKIENAPWYEKRVLCLPCSVGLTTDEIDYVKEALR